MDLAFMLLYLFAGVCFGLAVGGRSFAFGDGTRKLDLLALGLLLWVVVEFIKSVHRL